MGKGCLHVPFLHSLMQESYKISMTNCIILKHHKAQQTLYIILGGPHFDMLL
jgi:hypothetical protein